MNRKIFIKYIATCLALILGYAIFGNIGLLIGLTAVFVWKTE